MNRITGWKLPDPFLKEDGSRIETIHEWDAQRAYLKDILAKNFYGEMPPAPGQITSEKTFEKTLWDGTAIFEVQTLTFGPEDKVSMRTAIIRSAQADGPQIPVVLCGGYVAEDIARMAVERGFMIATPLCDDAAPDEPGYQKGSLYQSYPEYGFKVIAMWGWLMSRVIDYLETVDYADTTKVIAAGHSRFGKAALACSVYDERVAVCAAGGSGCGGIGSLRVGGGRAGEGIGDVETLGGMITGYFPHWFIDSLVPYGAKEASDHYRENELPFDANFIGAAIAPRPLILVEGMDDTWANPYGTYASWSASAEVYHFLGADDKCAIHFREGGHDLNMEDWQTFLDFALVQLNGAEKHSTYKVRVAEEPPVARDWKAPGLEGPSPKNAGFTPEQKAAFRERLNQKWAFTEAGLETGIDRMIKMFLDME